MMRRWKVLCVKLRCRATGLDREYAIETPPNCFWPYAERTAMRMAIADGLVDPEHRGGEWINNPWTRRDNL